MQDSRVRHGFSLLELSIVLVIIGLLAGGVMTGQSLIRAAEQRSVITQFTQFTTALHTFRDKYQALPGDMLKATSFWGDNPNFAPAGCPDSTVANGDPGTCNGNGTGIIGANGMVTNENYRAWQHLAMAGLIEGTYRGRLQDYLGIAEPGIDIPVAKIANSGWTFVTLNQARFYNNEFSYSDLPGQYNPYLLLGGAQTDKWAVGPAISPPEAWAIDKKLDDSKPGYGRVRGYTYGTPGTDTCVSSLTAASATYNLTLTGTLCAVGFILP